ncbi:sialate O-acetylesterase, partial [Massilia sp. YIM B02443]|uniref:sialate O-acetylesterase n=1 Tax=Massilia sp. YIM B02443 TaxID=3050127 RepID=UPI0025B667F1
MIKLDRAAGNQSISTPDHVVLVFPNGDWLLLAIVGFDGVVAGNVTQYHFSSGAFGASGSLNVVHYGDGVSGTTLRSRIAVYADTLSNANAPALLSTTQFTGGRHLIAVQRSGGTQSPLATLYSCPVLATAPIDDSAVITEATTTNAAILKELNGSGFMFGSRVDNTADRKSDGSYSRMLRLNRALTKFEIAQLAAGKEISDLGYTPVLYVRGSDIADIADRGPNALPFTLAGSPTTSAEPTFAYREGVSEPPAAADAVTVSNAEPLQVVPSTGTGATVTFTGALSGTQPTGVEVRMIAPDGAPGNWVALQSATIGATAYSGVRAVPDGGPYQFQARTKSGSAVLAESQYSTAKILVGDAWINCGSSSSDYLFTDKSGTGFTVAPDTAVMSGTTPAWSAMSSTGAATRMADELATVAGKPIAWLNYGVAGTTLRTWLDPNSTQRKDLARAVAAVKGKIFGAYITVGANDAYNGWITSSAQHEADMQALIEVLRTLTGNPDLKIIWVGSPPRQLLNPVQADRLRQAESRIGNYPGVVQVQALQFAPASDNVHLAPSLDGYAACGSMAMHQAGRAFYLGEDPKMVRGPQLASMTYAGTKVRCVVTTRDGTSFNPAAPGGFTVQNKQLDGSYVTLSGITAQRVNAGLIEIECGVALVEPIVKYLSGSAPNMTNAVFSNGALPLPMTVETEMVATQAAAVPDTTAPVMSGAISITNVTTSGATLSFQAATDDVGVAGYEYSINGGTSYVNAGLSRSFTVSALTASTTYPVRARAYDEAGNRSAPLSASFTTLASEPPVEIVIDASKIPASRKVVFP